MNDKPLIYVSHTHADKTFVDELEKFLRPLERTEGLQFWHDRHKIKRGQNWGPAVLTALEKADIAILFVSADYLASDWIQQHELPQILDRQKQKQIIVFPIIVRPADWVHTRLAYYQVWPRDGKPLSSLSRLERDGLWTEFTKALISALHQQTESIARPKSEPIVGEANSVANASRLERNGTAATPIDEPVSTSPTRPSFFISHAKEDGDFAENLKSRLTQAGYTGWIDVDVLEAGTDWRKEIDVAISHSAAVILVISPDSKASEYVTYEWAYGLGLSKRVVPLLLRQTPIHPRLEAFQYLDFTNRRARPWERLLSLLAEIGNGSTNV